MKKKIPLFNKFLLFLDDNLPEISTGDLCNLISTIILLFLCIFIITTRL